MTIDEDLLEQWRTEFARMIRGLFWSLHAHERGPRRDPTEVEYFVSSWSHRFFPQQAEKIARAYPMPPRPDAADRLPEVAAQELDLWKCQRWVLVLAWTKATREWIRDEMTKP